MGEGDWGLSAAFRAVVEVALIVSKRMKLTFWKFHLTLPRGKGGA